MIVETATLLPALNANKNYVISYLHKSVPNLDMKTKKELTVYDYYAGIIAMLSRADAPKRINLATAVAPSTSTNSNSLLINQSFYRFALLTAYYMRDINPGIGSSVGEAHRDSVYNFLLMLETTVTKPWTKHKVSATQLTTAAANSRNIRDLNVLSGVSSSNALSYLPEFVLLEQYSKELQILQAYLPTYMENT